jgi:hypothetical protein
MPILNRDDLVPDDIQREKREREFRRRAWEILREELAKRKREEQKKCD